MGSKQPFEFRARFIELDEGLEVLHTSVERLRQAMGRTVDDRPLMLFETALGEIGSNVLTHGRPPGTEMPVDYVLRFEGGVVEASLTDSGAPVHEHLKREMPAHESERGRGLAMARSLLDELGYRRDGDVNRWRLVKRL
ncbi:MAG: ATP-binding protein [Chloroflexi bacterium]|nr:MAG: ATP-binding protein [Chloroflexota bacterium]